MEEGGARILPITADITDAERLKAVVEECVERFGRLDGVIHAPAEGGSQAALLPVTEIDGESFAGLIQQRVRGAAVLARIDLRWERSRAYRRAPGAVLVRYLASRQRRA
ncbi:MAG: SDR family oxidoreductase [bacterium]|nr:SDR family oxidoreductase [bacterium]